MSNQTKSPYILKVAIIGAGAMGGAIARGLIAAAPDFIAPGDITVANPTAGKLMPLGKLGAVVTASNVEAVVGAELVVVCVKPWILPDVLKEIKPHLDYGCVEVAVVAASVTIEDLAEELVKIDDERPLPQLCLMMPNTAVSLRKSMTFQVNGVGDCERSRKAFSLLGDVMVIEERQLPAATSLASCGIAYALRYVRAASEGGVELGFKAGQAQEIVAKTLVGAAALLAQPGAHAEAEIDKVTTPGGLTIRGLNAMERAGFSNAVIEGLKASTPPRK